MSRPRLAAGRHPLPARRRQLLVAGAAAPLLLTLRPLYATPAAMAAAIAGFTGGVKPQEGKVTLEIAQLIDNGNTVPVRIRVDSPMTEAEHVTDIGLFNERNPLPDVVRFRLTPRLGKAEVATRIRLATSQTLVAVARLGDGSWWQQSADVVVTLAACIEGEVN
jgi:sulfur-oxidizing protein SoxY